MINILADQHNGKYTSCNRNCSRKCIHKYMSQEGMINLIVIILLRQQKGRNSHCTGADQRHLYGFKWICTSKKDSNQCKHYREHCLDQKHGRCTSDIIYYPASLIYNMRHGRKIGIQQYHIGNILGCITSCCHGNTAVCFLQCQNIIYTITGHGNCMLLGL